jgi:hypothetical protein
VGDFIRVKGAVDTVELEVEGVWAENPITKIDIASLCTLSSVGVSSFLYLTQTIEERLRERYVVWRLI